MNQTRILAAVTLLACSLSLAISTVTHAATVTIFDSPSFAESETTRSSWLGAIGISSPEHLVDFESGFSDNERINGVPSPQLQGMVLRSTTGTELNRVRIVQGPGSIKQSDPIGEFAALHPNDLQYFVMDFTANPINYLGFRDIDHEGLSGQIIFVGGEVFQFDGIDETLNQDTSAEFVGFVSDTLIERVNIEGSGDSGWGVDNVEFGTAVPEPGSFVVLAAASILGVIFPRRKRRRL